MPNPTLPLIACGIAAVDDRKTSIRAGVNRIVKKAKLEHQEALSRRPKRDKVKIPAVRQKQASPKTTEGHVPEKKESQHALKSGHITGNPRTPNILSRGLLIRDVMDKLYPDPPIPLDHTVGQGELSSTRFHLVSSSYLMSFPPWFTRVIHIIRPYIALTDCDDVAWNSAVLTACRRFYYVRVVARARRACLDCYEAELHEQKELAWKRSYRSFVWVRIDSAWVQSQS